MARAGGAAGFEQLQIFYIWKLYPKMARRVFNAITATNQHWQAITY